MAIQSFHSQDAQALFEGISVSARLMQIQAAALRRLTQLHAAASLNDLRVPTTNRLEALAGKKRKGQHSIRINDQYRVCFIWTDLGPARVEIVDYHDEKR